MFTTLSTLITMAGDDSIPILKDGLCFFKDVRLVNELMVLCITSHKPKLCSSYDLNRASAVLLVFPVHPHVHFCVFCPLSGLSAMCWLCRSLSRRKPAFLLKTRPKIPHSSMCCALPRLLPSSCMTRHSHTWTKVRQIRCPHSRGRIKGLVLLSVALHSERTIVV